MSNSYAAKVAMDQANTEAGLYCTPRLDADLRDQINLERHRQGKPPLSLPSEVSANVNDPVNQPKHYTGHPSGVECIQITEHMGFNLGNAMKYIWRCDLKLDAVEDLKKAAWYINREIAKREKAGA